MSVCDFVTFDGLGFGNWCWCPGIYLRVLAPYDLTRGGDEPKVAHIHLQSRVFRAQSSGSVFQDSRRDFAVSASFFEETAARFGVDVSSLRF
jgi:hypothetical protein